MARCGAGGAPLKTGRAPQRSGPQRSAAALRLLPRAQEASKPAAWTPPSRCGALVRCGSDAVAFVSSALLSLSCVDGALCKRLIQLGLQDMFVWKACSIHAVPNFTYSRVQATMMTASWGMAATSHQPRQSRWLAATVSSCLESQWGCTHVASPPPKPAQVSPPCARHRIETPENYADKQSGACMPCAVLWLLAAAGLLVLRCLT